MDSVFIRGSVKFEQKYSFPDETAENILFKKYSLQKYSLPDETGDARCDSDGGGYNIYRI